MSACGAWFAYQKLFFAAAASARGRFRGYQTSACAIIANSAADRHCAALLRDKRGCAREMARGEDIAAHQTPLHVAAHSTIAAHHGFADAAGARTHGVWRLTCSKHNNVSAIVA